MKQLVDKNCWLSACALSDYYQESRLFMKPGDAVYVQTPLDFTVGIIEDCDGAFLRMLPGCVTSREVTNETQLVATGKPGTTLYKVCPRGRLVPMAAIGGVDYLPSFDPADWPPLD
jgi:hypothetical protein